MFTFAEDMAIRSKKQVKPKENTVAMLQRIKRGDEQFLSQLYEVYQKDFLKLGFKYLNDEAKILAVYQDAFVAFYENIRTDKVTDLKSTVKSYIFSIGKYKLVHQFKAEIKQVSDEDIAEFELVNISFEQQQNLSKTQLLLQSALAQLDTASRKLLVLSHYRKYDMEFIVEAMSYKNADAVQSQEKDAIDSLKKILSNQTDLQDELPFNQNLQSALGNKSRQLMKTKLVQLDQKIVARQSMNKFFVLIGVLLFIFVGSLIIWNMTQSS